MTKEEAIEFYKESVKTVKSTKQLADLLRIKGLTEQAKKVEATIPAAQKMSDEILERLNQEGIKVE